jgi:quercetin dioxygenase-like cupin family protein
MRATSIQFSHRDTARETHRLGRNSRRKLNDKVVRKLAWGKTMIGQTLVEKGYFVALHAHVNQQVTFVTSGLCRFRLEGRTVDVGPNEMISIPANVPHTAEAVETLIAYDVFTPPREHWINGDDAYLRAK